MNPSAEFLMALGGVALLGLLASAIARHTFLPRVTLLLLLGLLVGDEGVGLLPPVLTEKFDLIAEMTLLMVGFLLGGKLIRKALAESLGHVMWISITAALLTTILVSSALYLLDLPLGLAIILGSIAAATAPAAIYDVVTSAKKKTFFGWLLLSIVAIDDVWALLLFAMGIALVKAVNGSGGAEFIHLAGVLHEVGGAFLLGLVLGLPAAVLTGRYRPGEPMLTEALGLVFFCGGLALYFDVSYLIAVMTMGAVIANLAKHHDYPFHAIEGVEYTFMVIFFVLAGASLEISALADLGLVGLCYVVFRFLGKYLGAFIGAHISGADPVTKRWMGAALMPQAGVPIGMALVAAGHFPEYRQLLLSVVISSTVFFEIIGPILTRQALIRAERAEAEKEMGEN